MYKYFYLLCNTFGHVAQPHPAARCEAAASGSAATIMMMMCKLAVGRLISTLAQAHSHRQRHSPKPRHGTAPRRTATGPVVAVADCVWCVPLASCSCCKLPLCPLPVAARAVARRRPNALSHAIDSIPTAIKTAAASQ